jgi:hypothetical protein
LTEQSDAQSGGIILNDGGNPGDLNAPSVS